MKRILSLVLASALAALFCVPAFAADLEIPVTDKEGYGGNRGAWEIKDGALSFTRNALGEDIIIDIDLDKAYDVSGYEYILMDFMVPEASALKNIYDFWLVIASEGDVDGKNIRTTANGYAGPDGQNSRPAGTDVTGKAAGEWFTVYFPIHNNYAWDSHTDACDMTAINKFRVQITYYEGMALLAPGDAEFQIKNVRLSNDLPGQAAAEVSEDPVSQDATGESKDAPANPQTGDESLMLLAVAALLLSASAFVILRKRVRA